jgi:hypothetical protein
MQEDFDPEIAQWLREEGRRPGPEPSDDLIARTIARIQDWMLLRDLMAFATLEGLWKALSRPRSDRSSTSGASGPERPEP